jgi:hypothetical protein
MNAEANIEKIKSTITQINTLVQEMHEDTTLYFFQPVSAPWQRINPSELGFIRVVSWLYILYIDIRQNQKNIDFVLRQINTKSNHKIHIHRLRTYFQHQLNLNDKSDEQKKEDCDNFFYAIIRKNYPTTEEEWEESFVELTDNANTFLNEIYQWLKKLEKFSPNMQKNTIDNWRKELFNTHEKYEYEQVFKSVANSIGLDALSNYEITTLNLDKWRKALDLLDKGYDFNYELSKIIEQRLIAEEVIIPIGGIDFEGEGVPKGKILGEYIKKARKIYYASPCSKEELLSKTMAQMKPIFDI